MKMMRKLEEKDMERFRQIQLLRKQQKRRVQKEFGESPHNEYVSSCITHEQRGMAEGDFRMSNTSEGGSSMSSVPEGEFMRGSCDGDFTRSSTQEEDFKMGGMLEEDFRKGSAPSENHVMFVKEEDDLMVASTASTGPSF